MRNTSSAFRRALYDGNRNYQCTAYITLVDNTELTITNARIAQGGVSLDDNVSDTSSFTALGSAIINALTLQINNVYEEYSEYDFTGADVVLYIALSGVQESPIKICTMTVEKATYNGMIITLECLDNMVNFDTPYTSTLTYPATLQSIVFDACTDCGVVLGTTTFPNYTFEVPTRPNDEALTYREVISYVATLAGCFARCNSNGSLELKWFDKNALIAIEDVINGGIFDEDSPYSTGDTVDGGIFNPWNTGDEVDGGAFTDSINAHYITALASQELGIENVVITGIQITVENEVETEEETRTDVITRTYGTSDYVIKIENNPFITLTNMDTIGAFLQNQLAGLTFRYGTVTHLNDPAIEAGDVAMVWDRKGNAYPLLVTNTQFEVGSYQTTTCSTDTPVKNSATRFSALTKSFVQNKEVVRKESNALETRLNQAINAKAGMYETREPVGTTGAYIYYMHDKPNLSESSAVIKITNEAVAVTPDYQASPIQWYGLTVDGNFIANIMSVIGINFDWGTGGTLTLGGQNNQNGILTILDASGNTIGTWDNQGLKIYDIINDEGMNIVKFDPNGAIDTPYKSLIIVESDFERDSTYMSQMVGTGSPLLIYEGTDTLVAPKLTSDEAIDAINTLHYVALKDGYTYSSIQTTGRIASMTVSDTIFAFGYLSENIHIDRDCSDESTLTVTTSAGTITITGQVEYSVNTGKFTQRVYASQSASMPQVIDNISVITDGIHYTYHQYYKVPSYLLGTSSKSVGAFSAGIGRELDVSEDYQYVIGRANAASNGTFIIGNGSESINMYRNAFVIAYSGDIRQFTYDKKGAWVAGSVRTFENAIYDEDGASEYSPETVSKMAGWGLEYFGGASLLAPHNDAYNKFFIKVYNNEEDSTAYSEFGFKRAVPGDTILTIRGGTANSNAYASANPKLEFQNSNASQNIALVFTDFDSVQAPASLTLAGNQGGEFFICPQLKVTENIHGNGKCAFRLNHDTWLRINDLGNYTSGVYFGSKEVRNDGRISSGYATNTDGFSYIDRGVVSAGKQSGEAQTFATIHNSSGTVTNRIYMYANADGRVGIYSVTAAGTGVAIISRANNSNVTTFGSGNGNVLTYGYNYGASAPVVSNSTANNRVSHLAGHSTYIAMMVQADASGWSNKTINFSSSDIRLKENIADPDLDALPVINSIQMHSFDWKDAHKYKHHPLGMVADELEEIDPRFAVGGGYDEDGNILEKSVDTFYLVGYLVKAVQELSAELEKLKKEVY